MALEIPPEETRVAFVNGHIHDMDWELKTEDEVGLFPPVGGG
jgi:molybdopterin converting factor small subunit